jgi:hypothetical protein
LEEDQFLPLSYAFSRRGALITAGASLLTSLAGCGAAGIAASEGDGVFTWDVKLLNLAATEAAVSISESSIVYFSNAPYGQVTNKTFVLDDFVVKNVSLKVAGSSEFTANLSARNIGPALYLLTSTGDPSGNTTGYLLSLAGGVPGSYDSQGVGHNANSILMHTTSALGIVDVYSRTALANPLVKIGSLGSGGSVSITSAAVDTFQLVFRDPTSGSVVYDSGGRVKTANTLFVIARTSTKSAGWSVFTVDSSFNSKIWVSV